MTNKQAIENLKLGKNIPYKRQTILTLINMADKLEMIEQIIKDHDNISISKDYWYIDRIREILEQE